MVHPFLSGYDDKYDTKDVGLAPVPPKLWKPDLIPLLLPDEQRIDYQEMLRRMAHPRIPLRPLPLLGQHHASWLMEKRWRAPPEFVGCTILFPGTTFTGKERGEDYVFIPVLRVASWAGLSPGLQCVSVHDFDPKCMVVDLQV